MIKFKGEGTMLNRQEIKGLIKNGLVADYIDLETQLTPNGFDLTAGYIYEFSSAGALDFSNKERILPEVKELIPQKRSPLDKFGWWNLSRGIYKVKTNETINMPNNLTALAFTRTSILRMGAFTANGVWDAGFCGRSEFALVVENPCGIQLKQNARVAQIVFIPVEETELYNGIYKNLK